MQFKKILKVSMLAGLISVGSTYFFSNHAEASIKNEFPRIKKNSDLNGNNLKLNKVNSSATRSKKYKLISRSKIKTKLFFQKSGYLYSKHLGSKYSIYTIYKENNATSDGFAFYADAKEKFYNKKTKRYNTYYHLSSLNGTTLGWTWDKNLVAYQSSNTKLNKTISNIFPGAKVNSDLQYLVNMGQINSYGDMSISDNPYYDHIDELTGNTNKVTNAVAFRIPYKNNLAPLKFEKNLLRKLKSGNISYKKYASKVINNDPNLVKKSYKNYQVGILSYPQSSPHYGYFSLILEKK